MPIVLDVKRGEYPKFSQATEDIIVYKVLHVGENGTLTSMFYDDKWNPTYKIRPLGVFTKLPGKTPSREFVVSNEGLYSFRNLNSAKKFRNAYTGAERFSKGGLTILEAIIPRGSMYLQHNNQYLSNQLMLTNVKN